MPTNKLNPNTKWQLAEHLAYIYEVLGGTVTGGFTIESEKPTGVMNGVNTSFTTEETFVVGTLLVYLSGLRLTPGTDYEEMEDGTGFTILIDPNDANRLKVAPLQNESFTVTYLKVINT
jgi:hypothetical protein